METRSLACSDSRLAVDERRPAALTFGRGECHSSENMFARRSFRASEETKKTTAKRTSGVGGGGGMAQQPAATRLGLVRCEHCARQFNPHSAARHIPWCAKQQSESRKHRLSQDKRLALERYKWRISYKPTNHFVPAAGAADQLTSGKKGSINSSGTLSSPSASSTNSLGAASNSTSASNNRRQSSFQRFQEQAATQQRSENHWLKRSISSVTLTKQSGSLEAGGDNEVSARGSPAAENARRTARTKSTNDVRRCSQAQDIGEIVENLAARLEEIYAQNQMLVARLIDRDQRGRLAEFGDSQRDAEAEAERSASSSCHHCKSARLALANYCHRCGCKLPPPPPPPQPQSSRAADGAESPG